MKAIETDCAVDKQTGTMRLVSYDLGSCRADEVIVEVAKQKEAGLIVMASHGRTVLKSLMGSMTERFLSHGSTAVLVAKIP